MKKKTIIKSIFTETNTNDWSHKRLIGVISAFSLIILMISCSIWDLKPPPPTLVSAVEMLAIVCIAGTAVEKFANYRRNIHPNQQQYPEQFPQESYEYQISKTNENTQNNPKNIEENEN